jgi:hypothetical protein
VILSDQEDRIAWNLGRKGFSVNSIYRKKMADQVLIPYKFLWKSKTATENQDFHVVGCEK